MSTKGTTGSKLHGYHFIPAAIEVLLGCTNEFRKTAERNGREIYNIIFKLADSDSCLILLS